MVHAGPIGEALSMAVTGQRPKTIAFLYDLNPAATVTPRLPCELVGLHGEEAIRALHVLQGRAVAASKGIFGRCMRR